MPHCHATNQSTANGSAKFAICVDLGASASSGDQRIEIRKIIQLLEQHRIAATWAVGDARGLSYVVPLLDGPIRHQVALTISPAAGSGCSASQSLFQKQLDSQLAPFQESGIPVQTALIPSIREMHSHYGPLARHGLTTMVVGARHVQQPPTETSAHAVAPHKLPHGLWHLPVNVHLPARHSWFANIGFQRKQAIRLNGLDSTPIHVLISVSQVAADPEPILRQLGRLLHQIAWAESRRRLQVITANAWADEKARQTAAQPQRSILKIAA
jgi:hypothetical protein